MRLESLRDRLIGIVLEEYTTLPREFVQSNWDYLKYSVDKSLEKYNKSLILRKPSLMYLILEFISFICVGCLSYFYLKYDIWKCLALSSFVLLNLDLVYYKDFKKLVHSLHVRFNYKVRDYSMLKDRFGYSLVYIATDYKDFRKIIIMSAVKPKSKIKYQNPRLYIVSRRCLHSVIVDYTSNRKTSTFNELKYDIYLSLNQEYINFQVINGLISLDDIY